MSKRSYKRYVTKEKLEKVDKKNKDLINKFFSFKNMNLSDATKKNYESDFNQWLVFINEKYGDGLLSHEFILDIIKNDSDEMVDLIEDFIFFCTSELNNNERRIQRRLSSISSFFLFLRKKRKIKENPVDFVERPSVSAGEKIQVKQNYLDESQIDTIRRSLRRTGQKQLELYFELSLSTMARVNAINNIKVSQINFENKIIDDVLEKEGYRVTLFPSDRALKLVKDWLKDRKEMGINHESLFIAKYNGEWKQVSKSSMQSSWIRKIGKIVDIDNLHAHDLRHSGSSLLYNKGMALEDVQKLLNHKSPNTTLDHYIKQDVKKIQDKKQAFEI